MSHSFLELAQPPLDLDNKVFNMVLQRANLAKPNLTYCIVPGPFLVLRNCAEPHLLRLNRVKYLSMLLFRVCATCTTPIILENSTSSTMHTLHRECPWSAKCYGVDVQWGCSGGDGATLAAGGKRVDWPLQRVNSK